MKLEEILDLLMKEVPAPWSIQDDQIMATIIPGLVVAVKPVGIGACYVYVGAIYDKIEDPQKSGTGETYAAHLVFSGIITAVSILVNQYLESTDISKCNPYLLQELPVWARDVVRTHLQTLKNKQGKRLAKKKADLSAVRDRISRLGRILDMPDGAEGPFEDYLVEHLRSTFPDVVWEVKSGQYAAAMFTPSLHVLVRKGVKKDGFSRSVRWGGVEVVVHLGEHTAKQFFFEDHLLKCSPCQPVLNTVAKVVRSLVKAGDYEEIVQYTDLKALDETFKFTIRELLDADVEEMGESIEALRGTITKVNDLLHGTSDDFCIVLQNRIQHLENEIQNVRKKRLSYEIMLDIVRRT